MDNITLLEAFKHCAGTTSYWIGILVATFITITGCVGLKKSYDTGDGWGWGKSLVLLVLLGLFTASILLRPLDISANTTKEQASRGVYIGY